MKYIWSTLIKSDNAELKIMVSKPCLYNC